MNVWRGKTAGHKPCNWRTKSSKFLIREVLFFNFSVLGIRDGVLYMLGGALLVSYILLA